MSALPPKADIRSPGLTYPLCKTRHPESPCGARLCIGKQQSGANHSAEPTLIHINAALSIADDFLPDKTVCPFVQPCALGVCLEHEDFIMPTQMPTRSPANRSKNDHGSNSGKEVRGTFRARRRITNIAMICLPMNSKPDGIFGKDKWRGCD